MARHPSPTAAPAQAGRRLPPLVWLIGLTLLLAALIAALIIGIAPRARTPLPPQQPPTPPGIAMASVDDLLALPPGPDWQPRRLRDNPAVLVLQFPDLWVQGRALNRTAALIEKSAARRDRVLGDDELRRTIAAAGDSEASYFLGHDYRAQDLGRFFSLAQAQQVPLNADELRLRQLLLDSGLLSAVGPDRFEGSPAQALVSFSAEQAGNPGTPPNERLDHRRRASVLEHELSHGRYFTDAAYRRHCQRFWRERLSEAERQIWRRYLAGIDYDPGNEDLMANETQALLMHTPDARDFDAAALGMGEPALEALRARFRVPMESER